MKKVYLVQIVSNGSEFFNIFEKKEIAIQNCIYFIKMRLSLDENSEKLKILKTSLKEKSYAYEVGQDSTNHHIEIDCNIFEKYIIS